MNLAKRAKAWLPVVGIVLMVLTLAGCGGAVPHRLPPHPPALP